MKDTIRLSILLCCQCLSYVSLEMVHSTYILLGHSHVRAGEVLSLSSQPRPESWFTDIRLPQAAGPNEKWSLVTPSKV